MPRGKPTVQNEVYHLQKRAAQCQAEYEQAKRKKAEASDNCAQLRADLALAKLEGQRQANIESIEYRLEVAEADYWKHDEKMKTEWTERTRMIREFLEEMEDWTSRDGMENSDWEYINEVQRMYDQAVQRS